jgi:hypothetical protein
MPMQSVVGKSYEDDDPDPGSPSLQHFAEIAANLAELDDTKALR